MYHCADKLNRHVLPTILMESDKDSVRVRSVARSFTLKTNYSATLIDKAKGFEWLRSTGNESLIQETVNAGTLAAFCRNMILNEGKEPPPDIVKVSSYNSVTIAKYTPKAGSAE